MIRSFATWTGATAFAALVAVFATWPQALQMSSAMSSHHDAYFSVWRLMWISHALTTAPSHLFDANIFHPITGTLAFSDAMLLEGLIGAPFAWAHVPPVLLYNTLLVAGFAGSALAMFALVRHLTGANGPALVSATVFALAPYRIEHMMHLELQWAMWVPLTFWALHRAVEGPSFRFGVLAGVLLWLQIVSCVYYGVFLAIVLVPVAPLLLVLAGQRGIRALPGLGTGALIAVVLTLPYAWPYVQAARLVGARDGAEIAQYSAHPINYLSATSLSWLWDWTAGRWGARELRLYPGVVAGILAVASLAHHSRRHVLVYAVVTCVAIELSFGTNGSLYPWLSAHVAALSGLRSPARFAIIASSGIAVLAGLGAQVISERGVRTKGRGALAILVVLLLMAADYGNRPMALTEEDLGTPAPVYKVLRSAGPGAVADLPMPSPSQLPGRDPYYAAWSISHWHPIVNGYSGYYPRDYLQLLARMETFPDAASVTRLRTLNVRYVVVHREFFEPEHYTALMLKLAVHPAFRAYGAYRDPIGEANLFVMEP